MKRILVLVDLKRDPEYFLKSAFKIASKLHANLILAGLNNSVCVAEEINGTGAFFNEDHQYTTVEELVEFINDTPLPYDKFKPTVECNYLNDDDSVTLKAFIVKNNIWMVIRPMPSLFGDNAEILRDPMVQIADRINCPSLFLPEHFPVGLLDKISYFTDLRYCDTGVIRFLKSFNAFIFIMHLSASGLPDIDQKYAQEILSNEIAIKAFDKKLFLRNIRRANYRIEIEKAIVRDDIKMNVIVSKKHRLLEELLTSDAANHFYQLPLMILPFLNWFSCTM